MGLIFWSLSVIVKVQELEVRKEKGQTISWMIFEMPYVFSAGNFYDPLRFDVIDAGSVCIYVTRNASYHTVNTQVVPKTQLPQGRGCQ